MTHSVSELVTVQLKGGGGLKSKIFSFLNIWPLNKEIIFFGKYGYNPPYKVNEASKHDVHVRNFEYHESYRKIQCS